MEGPFYLAVGMGAAAALRFRIVGAAQFDDVAVFVFDDFFAFNDVGVFQADFLARSQAEEFLDRFFHEVAPFDI